MRRMICLLTALLLCATLILPGVASADTFVPSVTYKDGPIIVSAEQEAEDVEPCVVVTSILAAESKTTDIRQENRDLLLEVYEKLNDGSMTLPLDGNYVIRELVDVSYSVGACIEPGHTHEEDLAKEGVTIEVRFNLGIGKDTKMEVLHYHDGAWQSVKSVTNNGDGTVTCVFEHFCPVAFCVEETVVDTPAQTGDAAGQRLGLWLSTMVVSAVAVAVMILGRRKYGM